MSSVHWQLVELLLIQTGATIVIPDYPLAPHSTALEAYAFVESVYNQLLETTSPQHISLMGDSAGAGLALGLAQSLRDAGNPLPQQLILLAPFLDITMGNPGIAAVEKQDVILTVKGLQLAGAAYAGTLDHKDYRVSPIYGTFQGLPPMSIFIGTHDLFIADVRDFTQQLKSQNIAFNYFEYPNMVHDHIVLVNLPEAKHAITQIADLMR